MHEIDRWAVNTELCSWFHSYQFHNLVTQQLFHSEDFWLTVCISCISHCTFETQAGFPELRPFVRLLMAI